jgi:DNA-binding NtrC family response regulator
MPEVILIVHQEAAVRRRLRDALRSEGCQTREAACALDALMIAASTQPPVDVLLTHTALAGIDGPQLAERMKRAFPAMRAVYMEEPIDLEALMAAVRLALRSPVRKGLANAGGPGLPAVKSA